MMGEQVYLYQLIEFMAETTQDGKKSIDFVPTNWVEFDLLVGKCFAKFMPPPYNSENKRQLEQMIVDGDDPLDDWPRYPVTIRGGAATYKEAKQRLQRLTVEEFVYTSGCEEPRKKAELTTQSLADKAKKREKKISEIMTVPTLQKKLTTSLQKSSSDYSESSEEEFGNEVLVIDSSSSQNVGRKSKMDNNNNKKKSASVLQDKMKNSKQRGGMLQEKRITIAKNMTFQPISVSPTTSSPPPSISSPLSSPGLSQIDVSHHAMHFDREKCTKTSARDYLCTGNSLAEYDLKLIIKEIRNLRYEQRQMGAAINKLQDTLDVALTMRIGQIQTPIETFEAKYKLNLPLDTYDKFIEFDNKICEDAECRTSFIQMLSQKFDNEKTITKNITALFKKYTKDVALLFNAQKKVEGKYLFKDTTFSNCLLNVIDEKSASRLIPPISDKNYLTHLGTVLSNVRDWDTPRARSSK